jgi:hypothetical protein
MPSVSRTASRAAAAALPMPTGWVGLSSSSSGSRPTAVIMARHSATRAGNRLFSVRYEAYRIAVFIAALVSASDAGWRPSRE